MRSWETRVCPELRGLNAVVCSALISTDGPRFDSLAVTDHVIWMEADGSWVFGDKNSNPLDVDRTGTPFGIVCVDPTQDAPNTYLVGPPVSLGAASTEAPPRALTPDFDAAPPPKPSKSLSRSARRAELEALVEQARGSATSEGPLEARVQEILKTAFDDWANDRIDTTELERRKAAAPSQAAAEAPVSGRDMSAVNTAFAAYTTAAQVREAVQEAVQENKAAFEEYEAAIEDEDAAEAAVYSELAASVALESAPVREAPPSPRSRTYGDQTKISSFGTGAFPRGWSASPDVPWKAKV